MIFDRALLNRALFIDNSQVSTPCHTMLAVLRSVMLFLGLCLLSKVAKFPNFPKIPRFSKIPDSQISSLFPPESGILENLSVLVKLSEVATVLALFTKCCVPSQI